MDPVSAAGAPALDAARPPRQDAEAARARLLRSGLRLFAQQGYAKTSTRELAEDAGVNVASISYYFGDKAGLYRAVFTEPMGAPREGRCTIDRPGLSLRQALVELFDELLEPLRLGDTARLCMKLHFRELLEPTGLWEQQMAQGFRPMHDALLTVLRRHFGGVEADDELDRLAVCICGLGVHLHVGHDVIDQLAPRLNASTDALDRWAERLVMYALAMVEAERQRRSTDLEKR